MADSRSRWVAEMMRTSTGIDWLEPSGRTARSCSTRSSLTCSAGGMSPISSSSSVPPSAVWNRPLWLLLASVKAPFMWPNSSDSSSASGMAPQFTATNGFLARGLALWMARASSSLPAPLSPRSSTLASDWATIRASASTSSMRAERLTISLRQPSSPRRAGAMGGALRASAWAIFSSSSLPSKGLVR